MIGTPKARREAWRRGFWAATKADPSTGLLSQFSDGVGRELLKKSFTSGWARGRRAVCR
jgi:hypothetical protein